MDMCEQRKSLAAIWNICKADFWEILFWRHRGTLWVVNGCALSLTDGSQMNWKVWVRRHLFVRCILFIQVTCKQEIPESRSRLHWLYETTVAVAFENFCILFILFVLFVIFQATLRHSTGLRSRSLMDHRITISPKPFTISTSLPPAAMPMAFTTQVSFFIFIGNFLAKEPYN